MPSQSLVSALGAIVIVVLLGWLLRRAWMFLAERRRVDVSGRYVIVTGCDSGIGRGVVEQLVARGARVVALCLTSDGAEAAVAVGAERALQVDLSDEQAVQDCAAELARICEGRLWGVVHNAGVVLPGFVDYQPLSFYRRVMEVNFFAPVELTRLLLPCLRAAKGRVVLVSSVDGIVSLPGNAPYDASKFALEAYADALRVELGFWQVGVSVVNPATMKTPLSSSFFESHRKAWLEMQRLEPEGSWQHAWPREWLDDYIAHNTTMLQRIAQDPRHAIADIVHALTAKRPRLRYLSGTLAKTFFYALWVGPEHWAARVKAAMIHPPPVELPPAPTGLRRSLTAVAFVGAVGLVYLLSSAPPHAAGSRLNTTGTLHVNINVSDFERSLRFYEMLGFEVAMEVEPHAAAEVAGAVGMSSYVVRGALLAHADGSMIDLLEWQSPRDSEPPYPALNHFGIARVALTTTDIMADIARLRSEGVEFLSEQPAAVADGLGGETRFICMRDPDGTIVELVELGPVMGALQRLAGAAIGARGLQAAQDE